jgi:hypothetical protein
MRARCSGDVGGAAAVSGSISLDGGEGGGASAPSAPWFDWKIDYREFSQIYPGLAGEPEEPRAPVKAPAKADVPTLEADIAALVSAAAGNMRHSENIAPRPLPAPPQVPHLRVVPPSHGEDISRDEKKNVCVKVNEFRPDELRPDEFRPDEFRADELRPNELRSSELRPRERSWIDIRPGDAVHIVRTGGGLRTRPRLRAMVALTLGLAIGWIAVLPLSYFRTYLARAVDEPPPLVQIPRSDGAGLRPQVSADTRRDPANATGPASTANKNHARRLAQNATQPKPIKTSLIAPLPTGPSLTGPSLSAPQTVDVAVTDVARRNDPTARPLPFPESRPETLAGWTVREVNGSTAILDGPERSFKAARGDIVPGVGRLESIVRWGDRWIVATESGLISTP